MPFFVSRRKKRYFPTGRAAKWKVGTGRQVLSGLLCGMENGGIHAGISAIMVVCTVSGDAICPCDCRAVVGCKGQAGNVTDGL